MLPATVAGHPGGSLPPSVANEARGIISGVSSRRAVLATSGLLTVAGCLPADDEPRRRADADLRLRRRVAVEVRDLAAAYAAVRRAVPATAARLDPLAAEHEAHLAALEGPPAPTRSPSFPSGPATPVPTTAAAAVSWLAGLERAAAARRARQCLGAGPDLARLLASVGACEAAHAELLGGGA